MTTSTATPTAPARPAPTAPPPRRRRSALGRTPAAHYWMVVPALVLFFVLHTVPVIVGVFFSFTDYAGYGVWDFVGLRNYGALFQDDRVIEAYGFTFGVAIACTVLVNVIALGIALALNARIKFQALFRGIFFVPYVLSILVVGYVFQYIFANSLPQLLSGIPAFRDNILANPDWAWTAIVFLTVWQGVAFSTILYLAGLQTIPQELYEASSIDGASKRKQFTSITFPLIGAFFTINMVLAMKTYLQVFDQIIPLTNGGPGTSTESITLLIFRGGFQGGEYAYQTANAVVYLIVIVLVSIFQFKVLSRREAEF